MVNRNYLKLNKLLTKQLFLILLLVTNCISSKIPFIPPVEEWKTFDFGKTGLNPQTFKIKYPPFMKYRHDLSVDTSPGSFIGPGIIVHYDFGWNNGHSLGTEDTLGGYAVKINRSFTKEGKFYIHTYFNYFYPPVGLFISATCDRQEDIDLALRIFNTIIIYEPK